MPASLPDQALQYELERSVLKASVQALHHVDGIACLCNDTCELMRRHPAAVGDRVQGSGSNCNLLQPLRTAPGIGKITA